MIIIEKEGNGKAEGSKDDDAKRDAKRGGKGDGKKDKKSKKGGRNKNKANFKKNLFDEKTVPSVRPDDVGVELFRFAVSIQCGGGT